MGTPVLGEFLKLKALKKSAEVLVDNSGMSGLEASNHLHDTDKKNMYFSKQKGALIFELKRIEALGQLHIWNYNLPRHLSDGMKDITVSYSLDGKRFKRLGDFTLNPAYSSENELYDGNAASNVGEDRKPIDFCGIPAKFIKITPKSNFDGNGYGLSQIRVFRHKIRPSAGEAIPVDAFNYKENDVEPLFAFNGLGMSGRTSRRATSGTDAQYMWHTSKKENAFIVMNLDGTYPIRELAIWNYNALNAVDDGADEIEVAYTTREACRTINKIEKVMFKGQFAMQEEPTDLITGQEFDFTDGKWEILGKFKVPKGTGADKMPASLIIPFGDKQAQHIRITVLSNHGGKGYGLSEVRVFSGKGWAVEPARNWTGLLSTNGEFRYTGTAAQRDGGWIGADGIFSYNLDGPQVQGSTDENSNNMFVFQDTVVGKMNNYKGWTRERGFKASHNGWTNMSYLYLKGNQPDPRNARFVLQGEGSEHHPFGNLANQHYWLCDYVKVEDALYIVGIKYLGAWDKPGGAPGHDMVRIPLGKDGYPDLTKVPELLVEDVPDYIHLPEYEHIHFEAVLENTEDSGMPNPDGYIYIYGRSIGKRMVIARVKQEDYFKYEEREYWNGEEWIKGDPMVCADMKAVIGDYAVGNEASVSPINSGMFKGKYLNVFTAGSIDGQLAFTVADDKMGPFSKELTYIYWANERYKLPLEYYDGYPLEQWNYNAKAHHNISAPGELLISYHMGLQHGKYLTAALEYHHPWFVTLFEI